MDGSGAEAIPGLEGSHHDFAVLPGGSTAFLVWANQTLETSDLVERAPDGTLRTVVTLDGVLYTGVSRECHANSLRYYAAEDTFTVSDLGVSGVFQLSRQGQLLWSCPKTLYGVHGHQLLDDGNLLYFEAHNGNPVSTGPSPVYEYSFSGEGGSSTAHLEWTYVAEASSFVFGDVRRLPNGNTLVTYSTGSSIHEISPAGEIVRTLGGVGQFGYSDFRETLYGPPQ